MQKWRLLSLIVLAVSLLASCSKFSKLQKTGTDDEKYKAALDYYKTKDYYRAGILFEELIPILKGSTEQEMSQFYFAYCKFHQGLYAESTLYFKKFYETFARSDYAEEAAYMSAYSLYKDSPNHSLDQTSSVTAIDALQGFLNNYPNTEHRAECTEILKSLRVKLERKAYEKAKLYFQTKDYDISRLKSAVIAITNFQKDFPDSDYNEELGLLKIQAGFEYAKNSLESKQKERYDEAVGYYQNFVDKYPNNKGIKQAEKYYDTALKESIRLGELAKKEKERKDQEKAAKLGAGSQ
jgi:outer membrane protein assembly factor BamD